MHERVKHHCDNLFLFFSKEYLFFTWDDLSSPPSSTSHHDLMRKITELKTELRIFHLNSPQVSHTCCTVNEISITARVGHNRLHLKSYQRAQSALSVWLQRRFFIDSTETWRRLSITVSSSSEVSLWLLPYVQTRHLWIGTFEENILTTSVNISTVH